MEDQSNHPYFKHIEKYNTDEEYANKVNAVIRDSLNKQIEANVKRYLNANKIMMYDSGCFNEIDNNTWKLKK